MAGKRQTILWIVFSALSAVILVAGRAACRTYGVRVLFDSGSHILSTAASTVIAFAVCAVVSAAAYRLLDRLTKRLNRTAGGRPVRTGKWVFPALWGLIFASWIPAFLAYLPGITAYDTYVQSSQAMEGLAGMTKYHPPLHTILWAICIRAGAALGVDATLVYQPFQMLLLSFAFAVMLCYLFTGRCHRGIALAGLLYVILNPVIAIFSIEMVKDTVFAAFLILLTVQIAVLADAIGEEKTERAAGAGTEKTAGAWTEGMASAGTERTVSAGTEKTAGTGADGPADAVTEKAAGAETDGITVAEEDRPAAFWDPSRAQYWLYTAFLVAVTCLLRNNAVYMVVLFVPFACILARKYLIRVAAMLAGGLVIFMLINGPVYHAMGIREGNSREMLSVPIQQITTVYVLRKADLTDEERRSIGRFLPLNLLSHDYNPRFADIAKNDFKTDYYNEHKREFAELWIRLFGRFPQEYWGAFLALNVQLWYPGSPAVDLYAGRRYIETALYPSSYSDGVRWELFPGLLAFYEDVAECSSWMRLPVIRVLFALWTPVWLLAVSFFLLAARGRMEKTMILYMPFFLWLTYMAGPVSTTRYMFPIMAMYPLIAGVTLQTDSKEGRSSCPQN